MANRGTKGVFDRFAEATSNHVSRAWFFVACVLLIVLWFPTLFLLSVDDSQLIVNTATTIITFLMVALLENSQRRGDMAVQAKLDALAEGLRDLMDHENRKNDDVEFQSDIDDLEEAIGIEDEVGTKAAE